MNSVIEVACGEYGDNISSLVSAINNGKNDIRDGHPYPETKGDNLNNVNQKNGSTKNIEVKEEAKQDDNVPDKNDANNIQDKYTDKLPIESSTNRGILPKFATNDIAKHSSKFLFKLKINLTVIINL